MMPGYPRRRAAIDGRALTLVLLGACAGGTGETSFGSGRLPCEVEGYPCTWNEVAQDVVHRTDLLGEVAGLYGVGGAPLDSIAAFLREQPQVVAVEVSGTGVRYRLKGGRPAWVYPADELAHHRAEAVHGALGAAPTDERMPPWTSLRTGARRASPARHSTTRSLAGALARRLAPRTAHAAVAQRSTREGIAADTAGAPKRALILSPFEWEFPGTGDLFARRAGLIRDYSAKRGGSVTFHANLDAYEENPAELGQEHRLADGSPILTGGVDFEDFLHWDEYNLVMVASHGTTHRCTAAAPVGGDRLVRGDNTDGGERCPQIWAGRQRQESYGSHVGVEVVTFVKTLYAPHPGHTRAEATACAAALEDWERRRDAQWGSAEPEPTTDGGKPCRLDVGERESRLVALWTPFFEHHYPQGLSNVILFLASCLSGFNGVLVDHFAQPGNTNLMVVGFDTTVTAADAFDVGHGLLDLLDRGYHSEELIRRLKVMDRTGHMVGRALDLGDEGLPAQPAEILQSTTNPTHGRDVVLLVDPATGEELDDGAAVLVLGEPGDARPDSLRLRARVIGLRPSDPVDRVRLAVRIRGAGASGPHYVPNERVRDAVHQYDGDVALGRDVSEGERVDLEIEGTLPGGGESRWIYRNVRLVSSYWRAAIGTGHFPGTFSGWRGSARRMGNGMMVTLESDPELRPAVLVNITTGGNASGGPHALPMCSAEVVFSPSGNIVADVQSRRGANVCSGGAADGYPPAATVEIREVRDGWVEGWVEGTFFRGRPHPADPGERGPVRIDFRVPIACAVRVGDRCMG